MHFLNEFWVFRVLRSSFIYLVAEFFLQPRQEIKKQDLKNPKKHVVCNGSQIVPYLFLFPVKGFSTYIIFNIVAYVENDIAVLCIATCTSKQFNIKNLARFEPQTRVSPYHLSQLLFCFCFLVIAQTHYKFSPIVTKILNYYGNLLSGNLHSIGGILQDFLDIVFQRLQSKDFIPFGELRLGS